MSKPEPPELIEAISRLTSLLSSRAPLNVAYRVFHEVLRSRMPASNLFIALGSREGGILHFPYFVDELELVDNLEYLPFGGLTGHVIETGTTIWVRDRPEVLDEIGFRGPRPVDWVGLPLRGASGAGLGALVVQTYHEGLVYSSEDVAFLRLAADLLSLAIQIATIERELSIVRISALVEETSDLDSLYSGIHRIVAGLIPAARQSFIIARIDREAGLFHQVYCVDKKEIDDWSPWAIDQGLSGYVAADGGRSFVYEDGRTPPPEGYRLLGHKPAYWLGAALKLGATVIGVVMIQSYDPELPISREDEQALLGLCPHIGNAIARTELHDHSRSLRSKLTGH